MSFVDGTTQLLGFEFDAGITGAVLGVLAALGVSVQCFYLLTVSPATGFETSIYGAYPTVHWLAFGVVLSAGLFLFLLAAVAGTTHWRAGLVFVTINYGLMFAIPIFRGYRLFGRGAADRLAHLGSVLEILRTGRFGGLFYPLQHVLMTDLVLFTDLSRETVSYIFPFVVLMLYICSAGIFVRYLTNRRAALACGFFAATPLLFTHLHFSVNPSILSFMVVPLFAFLFERYRRHRERRNLGLVIVVGAAIVAFHPMTTAFVIMFLGTSFLFFQTYPKIRSHTVRRVSLLLPTAMGIVWFVWNTSFPGPRGLTRSIWFTWLQGGHSVGQAQVSRATSTPFTFRQLLLQFIDLYGPIFIYLFAAGIIGLVVIVRLSRSCDDFNETFLTYQFGVGFVLSVLFMMVYVIASNPIRISRYMTVMAVLLVAAFLSRSITQPTRSGRIAASVLSVAVVTAALLAGGTGYPANNQMTETEYQGTEFMLRHHDTSVPIRGFAMSRKMEYFVLGSNREAPSLRVGQSEYELAPALGYDDNRIAAKTFDESYLITKEFDVEFYTADTYTEAQREAVFLYGQSHVRQLGHDPTVQKLYSSGKFEGWRVYNRSRQSTT